MTQSRILLLAVFVLVTMFARSASAVPAGYTETYFNTGVPNGALAFGPDGTLYIAQGYLNLGQSTNIIKVIKPDGTAGADITVANVGMLSIGGMTWDPIDSRLLITDQAHLAADGHSTSSAVYSVNPTTGAEVTFNTGSRFISDVAVRNSGQIFVSYSGSAPSGAVYMVDRTTGQKIAIPTLTGLSLTAGIAFDSHNNLIVQDAILGTGGAPSTGRFYKVTITDNADHSITVGSPQSIANVVGASFDFALDSSDNIYATGSSGLFRIDAATSAVTQFDTIAPDPFAVTTFGQGTDPTTDFLTEIAYMPGASGASGSTFTGRLDYLSTLTAGVGHASSTLYVITASGNTVWNINGSGSWNAAGNWTGGIPGLNTGSPSTDVATFDNTALAINTSAIVSLNGVNPSLKGITFNTTGGGFTIAQGTPGTGVLTLNNGTSAATITVNNGSHTISAPLTLASDTNITLDSGATNNATSLTLSGAQTWAGHNLTFSSTGAGTGARTVTVSGSPADAGGATLTVNLGITANINSSITNLSLTNNGTTNLGASQTLVGPTGLTIGAGAHTNVTTSNPGITQIGPNVIVTPSLTIAHDLSGAWTGFLDLANNKLVVQTGSLSGTALQNAVLQIDNQVKSGYNLANGNATVWMGPGISSSTAASDSHRNVGLAVFQNNTNSFGSTDGTVSNGSGAAKFSTFGGVAVALNDTLVKYTYYGDTDLDGKITAGDYTNIDLAFAHQQTLGNQSGWANGDFDYDGHITAADYSLIDAAFAAQTTVLSDDVHTLGSLADSANSPSSISAVPEPSTVVLFSFSAGLFGIYSARRRRCQRR